MNDDNYVENPFLFFEKLICYGDRNPLIKGLPKRIEIKLHKEDLEPFEKKIAEYTANPRAFTMANCKFAIGEISQ